VPCTVRLWFLLHRLVQDRHELTLQGPMVPLSALPQSLRQAFWNVLD
jgi:hypothetical protein